MKTKPTPRLTSPTAQTSGEVGYGNPPKDTRFRKGKSGNPKGRPKGVRNKTPVLADERMKEIILQEAYRSIKVRDGDLNVTMPMAQAVMRALSVNAAKGQHRSQHLFAELLGTTERANKALHDDWLQTAIAYKVDWERELERRDRLGIALPAPIPHPDDIVIDMRNGGVTIKGPMTKEEKVSYDEMRAARDAFRKDRKLALKALAKVKDPKEIKAIENDLAMTERVLAKLDQVLEEA